MTRQAGREARRRAFRSGRRAEAWCAWWLRLCGYRILARRHGSRHGEIDIVARRGKVVAFVEVKTRADRGRALAGVRAAQRQRIERAASAFLANRPELGEHTVRFDVIAVVRWRWPHHVADAWRP